MAIELLLVPLDETLIFPDMTATLTADVGSERQVLLVPRRDGDFAKVGTVAPAAMRGEEQLVLTGQLGEVMRESARIALSWVRSHAAELGIPGR